MDTGMAAESRPEHEAPKSGVLLGRWRDPLVGRDILFGLVLGSFWVIVVQMFIGYLIHIGDVPHIGSAEYLLGVRRTLGAALLLVPADIQATLLFFFLIFLFRLVLRNEWLAAGAFVLLFSTTQSLREDYFWTAMIVFIIIYSLAAIALVRFGLVSLAAALFLTDFLLNAPMTADFSKWFIGSTIFVYASAVALALFAFYTALAGQRLWKEELFE